MCQEDFGLLHDYKILYPHKNGLVEKCKICGDKQFFPENVPNDVYLSYHLRQAIQPFDKLFKVNYPNYIPL